MDKNFSKNWHEDYCGKIWIIHLKEYFNTNHFTTIMTRNRSLWRHREHWRIVHMSRGKNSFCSEDGLKGNNCQTYSNWGRYILFLFLEQLIPIYLIFADQSKLSALPAWFTRKKVIISDVTDHIRCNMLKLPPCATLMWSIVNSTKLSHPWVWGAEALITSPLPLTLEHPTHDHHLPFYFAP